MPELRIMGTKIMLEKALANLPPGLLPEGIKGGDTKIVWSPENGEEVANARRTFDDLRSKGFAAFRVKALGSKGEQIFSFDEKAEALIMTPPLRGG